MVIYPGVHYDPCLAKIFMGGPQEIRSREFVLEAGGRAVLALFANNIQHAQTFCSQSWFWDELGSYRSSGCLVFDSNSELKIRHANPCEAAELHTALDLEQFRREYDGFVFAFLVPVDADLQ